MFQSYLAHIQIKEKLMEFAMDLEPQCVLLRILRKIAVLRIANLIVPLMVGAQ
jgi:hypothetical protein